MAKAKRKERKASVEPKVFLKPIDFKKFGSEDDPCFGKLYDLSAPECKICGDQELCGVVFSQNMTKERTKIESKSKFKDLDLPRDFDNPTIIKWVKAKIKEGMKRTEVITLGMDLYGVTKSEMRLAHKKAKDGK